MEYQKAVIVVFAKAPLVGEVKTRLIPALGAERAAALQHWLIQDTLKRAADLDGVPIELWCAPTTDHDLFRDVTQRYDLVLYQQQGADLGDRMYTAFCEALQRYKQVVLIGTDCPGLDSNVLGQVISAIDEGHEVVIGPAADGGYVLIGLTQVSPRLFEGIEWGTGRVMAQTRMRLRELGWRWQELPEMLDLDRPEDLAEFQELTKVAF